VLGFFDKPFLSAEGGFLLSIAIFSFLKKKEKGFPLQTKFTELQWK
jgi:hypothetical protein